MSEMGTPSTVEPDATEETPGGARSARSIGLIAVAVTLLVGAGLLAVPTMREALGTVLRGDLVGLRDVLAENRRTTAFVLFGLAVLHVMIPFPFELPTAAAGFALGFALGFPLMLGSWFVSGMAAYALARLAGRPVIVGILGERRMLEGERYVDRAGAGGLLVLRLIPLVPFSGLCFVCGATRVPVRRYAWVTLVGTAPLTAITVVLGMRLQTPSLADPVLWGALVIVLLLVGLAFPVRRRMGARD